MTSGSTFRAWSAGCASGEEAYSIAILLSEFFGPRLPEYDIKIYATDIDEEALTTARRGEYSAEALRRIRPESKARYFHGKGTLRVNREIRKLLIFGRSNLVQNAPISHVNLLLCRNVLIYARLYYALEPEGFLLGQSESQLTDSTQFRWLNARWRIFRRITPGISMEADSEGQGNEEEIPGLAEFMEGDCFLPGSWCAYCSTLGAGFATAGHRLNSGKVGPVFAFPSELDLWLNGAIRSGPRKQLSANNPTAGIRDPVSSLAAAFARSRLLIRQLSDRAVLQQQRTQKLLQTVQILTQHRNGKTDRYQPHSGRVA